MPAPKPAVEHQVKPIAAKLERLKSEIIENTTVTDHHTGAPDEEEEEHDDDDGDIDAQLARMRLHLEGGTW